MSKNTCTPSRLFGGYTQSLFLGCSVTGWTATAGWNQQVGQLTVNLVQDPCQVPAGGNPKTYWDSKLVQKYTTAADPGPYIYGDNGILQGPIIGSPVYFRHGEFEFSGILQNFQELNGSDGRPTFTAVINDPRAILEGAQIIINNYAGSVYDMYNLFNVFGFMESFGSVCPERTVPTGSDVVFGTPAGGYGGMNVNDNGSQVSQIIAGVSLLTSAFPKIQNAFSPFGRLMYKGSKYGGYGAIRYDNVNFSILNDFGNPAYQPAENYHDGYLAEYFIDLSNLPVPPSYWRISDTYISVMELITRVCEDAGCDFYIELIPYVTGTSSIVKIIKVRTVSRNYQPRLGVIAEFIGDSTGIESNNKGLEARQEMTQSFLVGGKRSVVFQAEQEFDGDDDYSDDVIIPYFGKDANGEAIIPTKEDGAWRFTVDVSALNLTLSSVLPSNSLELTEEELQAALGGFGPWLGHIGTFNTASYQAIQSLHDIRGGGDLNHLKKVRDQVNLALCQGKDIPAAHGKTVFFVDDDAIKDTEKVFNFVATYAEEYGRRFLVRIPYTCRRQDSESGTIITSEVPSPDGGYTRQTTILDLPHPTVLTDFFGSEDGRVGCFIRIPNASTLDVDKLDINEYGIYNDNLYLKAELEPDLIFVNDTPRVIVNIPQAVIKKDSEQDYDEAMNELTKQRVRAAEKFRAGAGAEVAAVSKKAGGGIVFSFFRNKSAFPDGVAVPLQSNIHTYGPWYISGPPGPIKVEEDSGLVPWEYGGETEMNLAGASRVNEGLTYMQCGEYGSITVPGIPTIPLGGELGATYGSAGTHLLENRSILTNGYSNTHHTDGNQNYTYYSADLNGWTGLYGPNVTNINVSVGEGGPKTTYDFKTYTPQPGRFSRGNAERMKEFGQRRLKVQKQFRLNQFKNARLAGKFASKGSYKDPDRRKKDTPDPQQGAVQTPHDVLVGYVNDWKDGRRRVTVASESMKDLTNELANNYDKKAIMSWDGIFRPVKMGGSSPFPQYQTGYQNQLYGAQPPMNGLYATRTGGTYLNPLGIPGGDLDTQYGDGLTGHDFELVARGTTPPGSSLVLPIEGVGDWDYDNTDYRFFALKGPLVMQSWGYDLDGKPIPNQADVEASASGGSFVSTALEDTFMDGWLGKPHTWPVGAIDLRWDRNRKVWTIPTYNLVLMESSDGSTFAYSADNTKTLYDSVGANANSTAVDVGDDYVGNLDYAPTGTYSEKAILNYIPGNGLTQIERTKRATAYHCVTTHSITASSGTVTVGTLRPVDGQPTTASTIVASNDFAWDADSGAPAYITWKSDGISSKWVLTQVKCPA